MHYYPSRRGPGVAKQLSAIAAIPAGPGRRQVNPAPNPCAVITVLGPVCLALASLLVLVPGSSAGGAQAMDVARFGLPTPTSGRYLATSVRGHGHGDADVDALRLSQEHAIDLALRCTGIAAAPRLALRTDGIGGPSGGLMFALTLIDHFDSRDLSRGRNVAGTGAVRSDGSVVPVGGVAEKAEAAEAAGADLFFVPSSQVDEAARAAFTVDVIGVGSVDEAVEALSGRGCVAS